MIHYTATGPTGAEDRIAIQQVLEQERYWRDRKQWDRQLACYTDDCIVVAGWFQGSAQEFVARSRGAAENPHRLSGFHYFMPASIRMKGARALAESNCQVLVRYRVDGIEVDVATATRAFSRVRHTADGWKIASLHGIYMKDSISAAKPYEAVPMRPGDLAGLRPSYCMLSWVQGKAGQPSNPDMLGDDRPEELDAFYQEAEDWLAGG